MIREKDWNISTFTKTCACCEEEQEEEEVFVSVLLSCISESLETEDQEQQDGSSKCEESVSGESEKPEILRRDFCQDCWKKIPRAFQDEQNVQSADDVDYSETWNLSGEPEKILSYWQVKQEKDAEDNDKQEINYHELLEVWKGLWEKDRSGEKKQGEEGGYERRDGTLINQLRYIIALILERKQKLSVDDEICKDGDNYVIVDIVGSDEDSYTMLEPEIQNEDISRIKKEIEFLFH